MFLTHLAVALVPGLGWLFFLAWKTREDAGFRKTLLKIFLLGMTICIPAGFFNTSLELTLLFAGLGGPIFKFLLFLFVVGPVEEGLKFLVLYSEVYGGWQIRTPLDGVLMATASAIGFATYENAHYIQMFGYKVMALRAWACILGHVGFSAVFGHYLALAKLRRYNEKACLAEGLAFAALLHGGYDFAVSSKQWLLYPYVAALMALYGALRLLDFRPLAVRLMPALAEVPRSEDTLRMFRPRHFRVACGVERKRADEAIASMSSDDDGRRLAGLEAANMLEDQALFEKVQELTHDPVTSVRDLASKLHRSMKLKLRG